jgi:hypothetical protein
MANDNGFSQLEQLREVSEPAADASVMPAVSPDDELGCALCYRIFPATELTVASKERFNFESAVVVCPDCLGQLQAEMKEKTGNADLTLGTIWGVLGWLVVTVPLALVIWFNYKWPERELWLWLGCFIAFLPGFVIGRAVFYGTGRKRSWKQQVIAMVLTFLSALVLCYVGQNAAVNLQLDILYKNGHELQFINPLTFLTEQFISGFVGYQLSKLALAGVVFGLLVGLVVAWFASAGPNLYTRPFVNVPGAKPAKPEKKKKAKKVQEQEPDETEV